LKKHLPNSIVLGVCGGLEFKLSLPAAIDSSLKAETLNFFAYLAAIGNLSCRCASKEPSSFNESILDKHVRLGGDK